MTTDTAHFLDNVFRQNNSTYTFVSSQDYCESASSTEQEINSSEKQQLDTYPKSRPSTRWNRLQQRLKRKYNELRSRMPTGWHFGAWMAALEAGVVLLINLIILLFCAVKTGGSIGVTQIFEGDCNTVDRVTLGIHLVINVLGTLLLSASNYSMHNLNYNSSFFSTISANDYNWYLAQGPEMQDLPKNNWTFNWECASPKRVACSSPDAEPASWNSLGPSGCLQTYACSGPDIEPFNWELLNPSDCLQTYAMDFLSDRRDLVVVLGDYTSNNTFVNQLNSSMFPVASRGLSPGLTPFDWICDFTSGIPRQEGVTSCSTRSGEKSILQLDNGITLGDAIASFTQNPEPLTKDMSLMDDYSQSATLDRDGFPVTLCMNWTVFTAYVASHPSGNLALPLHKIVSGTRMVVVCPFAKALRVSDPHGDQRSTYFLNIPIRFGVPLIVYSALLHWLLSQSIFVVAVTFWNGDVLDKSNSITSCGYSPVAMILTIIIGASLVLSCLAVGCFKCLQCDMPLAGSCSKAIAAACHPPEDGSDPLKPMKWGVVPKIPDSSNPAIGHISFSSAEVSAPVPGCYYL
ncbi:hypothetical protein BDP27DRAFT_1368777 [Rhodocollybia butyracea]|uniref:DUF6536 domain-containing protein n=1 Tax=Rhodocollybia butyracea TaxID=206335 RepID=A0A9P5PI87_9AGAR|nr:hypothetical protein BDP27DRAFT_1368777 [Rhodocollybia butyracea]